MKKKLKELRAKLEELRSQAKALVTASELRGDTALTETEEKKLAELNTEVVSVRKQIETVEAAIKNFEDDVDNNRSEDASGEDAKGDKGGDNRSEGEDEKRGMKGGAKVEVKQEKEVYRSYGEQLQAIARVTYSLRRGEIGDEYRTDVNRLEAAQKRASGGLMTKLESDGGYLLEQKVDKTIKKTVFDDSPILSRVNTIPLAPGEREFLTFVLDDLSRADGVRFGGVSGEWLKEGETTTATKPKVKAWKCGIGKFMAKGRATSEMLKHAGQLEAILMDGMRGEYRYKLAEGIVSGEGIEDPFGVLNSKNPAKLKVAKESGQTLKIVLENVLKMNNRMIPSLAAGYAWFINPELMDYLPYMALELTNTSYPVFFPANASGELLGTLFGKPVIACEQCAAVGEEGDIVLANFSQYAVLSEGGERTDMSVHVYFDTDETAFRFIANGGGKPMRHGLIQLKNASANFKMGDFITLEKRNA